MRFYQLAFILISLFICGCTQNKTTSEASTPEVVMEHFLTAFVAYDYKTCAELLTNDATISIIRKDGNDKYASSHGSAHDWLSNIESSGVKDLDEFTVEILGTVSQTHHHGSTVTLKFNAKGVAEQFSFISSGFDTGNLVQTEAGWRIRHYSSFEEFIEG